MKPRIDRTNLKTVIIKAGRNHTFNVDISGEPPPEVKWMLNDVEVVANDHNVIKNVDYHSDFSLLNALRKQTGKYTITATNRNGTDSVTVEVTVLGKPSRPGGPLEVTDVRKEGCKLKWNPPEDDGGKPIQFYEVEKFDKETGRWTRCGKSDKPEFDVQGLTPGKEYLFRCVAVNDEGESEPLETTKGVIAKDPWGELACVAAGVVACIATATAVTASAGGAGRVSTYAYVCVTCSPLLPQTTTTVTGRTHSPITMQGLDSQPRPRQIS